jgi:hypothetical protein
MGIQQDAEELTSYTQWWSIKGHHTVEGEPAGFQVSVRLTKSHWSQTGDDIEVLMNRGLVWCQKEMAPKVKKRRK